MNCYLFQLYYSPPLSRVGLVGGFDPKVVGLNTGRVYQIFLFDALFIN